MNTARQTAAGLVRHLETGPDDQTARAPEPLQRARKRDVGSTWASTSSFVLFIGNLFGILVASNIGYVLANAFAIGGVRPTPQRPSELATTDQAPVLLTPIAVVLCALLLPLQMRRYRLVPDRRRGAVYGGTRRNHRASASLPCRCFFPVRRIVQDGESPTGERRRRPMRTRRKRVCWRRK